MIALDPEQTVEFWLPSDAAKAPAKRPTFITRFMTARQTAQCDKLLRAAIESSTVDEGIDALCDALRLGLAGWRNIDGAFDVDRLPDLLTYDELSGLPLAMLTAQRISEDDIKKSVVPLPSITGESASPATAQS